jgi:hypothetical protein
MVLLSRRAADAAHQLIVWRFRSYAMPVNPRTTASSF